MAAEILKYIEEKRSQGLGMVAQLIDPDDVQSFDNLVDLSERASKAGVDFFLVGGSLIVQSAKIDVVRALKQISTIPVVTFPSTPLQLHPEADAVLFLSLISGRNPEYLIGHHVTAAPMLRQMKQEILPTGYMLVDCGEATAAQYVSHSLPIPYNKPEIAAATALAGQMLGLRLLYIDGGSGADKPVSAAMVSAVRAWTKLPLMVGGGIRSAFQANELLSAGADVIVVGNGAWHNPGLVDALCALKKASP
jgi:putative glycerol-1-phosphate prenyltransferase